MDSTLATQMIRPLLICLTPVKNESWILERFLTCASVWADHIIVADQGSNDNSRAIAREFPKVTLLDNSSARFNEPERQKMLIDAAREIAGPKILVALDADEFFRADFIGGEEWNRMTSAVPGTVIDFTWACVLSDKRHYYEYPSVLPLAFVDDGSPHEGQLIHSPRVPVPESAPHLKMGVSVLHFSTIDDARFRSKMRWYQCYELLSGKWDRKLFELYRFYHMELCIAPSRLRALPNEWTAGYGAHVDLLNFRGQDYYHWDGEMLGLLKVHGPEKFRRVSIWEVDWPALQRSIGIGDEEDRLRDPRTLVEKLVHWWLAKTQIYYVPGAPGRNRVASFFHSWIRRMVKTMGW